MNIGVSFHVGSMSNLYVIKKTRHNRLQQLSLVNQVTWDRNGGKIRTGAESRVVVLVQSLQLVGLSFCVSNYGSLDMDKRWENN